MCADQLINIPILSYPILYIPTFTLGLTKTLNLLRIKTQHVPQMQQYIQYVCVGLLLT